MLGERCVEMSSWNVRTMDSVERRHVQGRSPRERGGVTFSPSCLSTKWRLMKRKLTELSEDCENIDAR